MKLPTIGPFSCSPLLRAAVLVKVAAHRFGCPYAEWMRRLIEDEIQTNRLDSYRPTQIPQLNTARLQNVVVPIKLSDAINERVRHLYNNPNRFGWYPTSTVEYVRAILETETWIGNKIPTMIPEKRRRNKALEQTEPEQGTGVHTNQSEKKASR